MIAAPGSTGLSDRLPARGTIAADDRFRDPGYPEGCASRSPDTGPAAPLHRNRLRLRGGWRRSVFHQGHRDQARVSGADRRHAAPHAAHATGRSDLSRHRRLRRPRPTPARGRAAPGPAGGQGSPGRCPRLLGGKLPRLQGPGISLGAVRAADPVHLPAVRGDLRRAVLSPADEAERRWPPSA